MDQHNLFQNRLCPDLWSEDGELHQEVKDKLIEIANRFYSYLKTDAPILDILFTGSLANVTWTEFSDIDLHLVLDFTKANIGTPELTRDFFLAKKNVWNDKRNIFIKQRPVELYAQHYLEDHASSGQYSLIQDGGKWLVFPEAITKEVDTDKVNELVQLFEKAIDRVAVITDVDVQFDEAVKLKNNIVKFRRKSIELDSELSIGNFVFKRLRNNPNALNRLFKIISSSLDKKLSLAEVKLISKELMNEDFTTAQDRQLREIIRKELEVILKKGQLTDEKAVRRIVRGMLLNMHKWMWDKKGIWIGSL